VWWSAKAGIVSPRLQARRRALTPGRGRPSIRGSRPCRTASTP
jgi:hypothetical protein